MWTLVTWFQGTASYIDGSYEMLMNIIQNLEESEIEWTENIIRTAGDIYTPDGRLLGTIYMK